MQEFIAKHQDKIAGTLSGFDRLVFRGHLRSIGHPRGMMTYLWFNQVCTRSAPTGMVTNAYLTQITHPTTNGVAHLDNFSYGYNDGELTQSSDENKQATTYRYDDSLGRLKASRGSPNSRSTVIS